MKNSRLNKKQQKTLTDLMEQIYKASITYEASENPDYLEKISTANNKIQALLNDEAYGIANTETKRQIKEFSQNIQILTTQLSENAIQYFIDETQELLNMVTEMLTKIEETW